MTFELYRKGVHGALLGDKEIRISNVVIAFGSEICKDLDKFGFCEIWLERENNKVGFKPTKNNVTGFKTPRRPNSISLFISSKSLASKFPKGSYEATKEKDIWVIQVPEIAKER